MKKKILMVVSSYLPEISGASVQCEQIINALKFKIDFKLLTFTYSKILSTSIFKKKKYTRIYSTNNSLISKSILLVKIFFYLFLNKDSIDIAHIHGITYKNIFICIILKLLRKKVIIKLSSFGEDNYNYLIKKSVFFSIIFFLSDIIICISPAFLNEFNNNNFLKKKIIFIPNSVNINKYKKIYFKKKIFNNNYKNMIYVGYYNYDKRPLFCLKVWHKLFVNGFKYNLILVLSKKKIHRDHLSIKNKINCFIKLNKISKYVKIIDYSENFSYFLKNSHIFFSPTIREGLSNTMLEAMASGNICIITKLLNVNDWVINNRINGFLFKKDSIKNVYQIFNNILKISNNDRVINNSIKTIEKNFLKDKSMNSFLRIYNNL